jgi:hypothetical protein
MSSAHNPTVITVMLGMNAGECRPFETDLFNKFTTGYRHILDTIHAQATNARVTVLESRPVTISPGLRSSPEATTPFS